MEKPVLVSVERVAVLYDVDQEQLIASLQAYGKWPRWSWAGRLIDAGWFNTLPGLRCIMDARFHRSGKP
jgi:hypothetical protein